MVIVRRHPISSFFVGAYLLTWVSWAPYLLSVDGIGLLDFQLPLLLGSSEIVGILPGAYLGPLTAAFVVTAVSEGQPGLRRWTGRLVRWRVGVKWYAAVLLGVPVILTAATISLPPAWGHFQPPTSAILMAYVPLLLLQSLTTGASEEPGWRDFALPRLQERFGPLVGTLILGSLWGAWHLPLFFTAWAGWPDVDWLIMVEFVAAAIPLSIVMTWFFNRTGESLPVVLLLHASINTTFSQAWPAMFPTLDPFRDSLHVQLVASLVVAALLLVSTRGQLGFTTPPSTGAEAATAGQFAQIAEKTTKGDAHPHESEFYR